MEKLTYKHTFCAAATGYVVQAIVNNLAPLLFIAFQGGFGLSQLQITSLITVNFMVQLLVDVFAAGYVDKMGYRAAAALSQALAAAGLAGMGVLPYLFANAYAGLLCAVVLCALGGGLLEVIISPIVEALPAGAKPHSLSLLHSFYCWGAVAVILLTTGFLAVAGIGAWRWAPICWALVPAVNLAVFLKVPLLPLSAEGRPAVPLKRLLRKGAFLLALLLMLCAGAAELAMSQWASFFAETGLGVNKAVGDLLGPCLFAVMMGSARAYFGRDRGISTEKLILISACGCAASYLITVFSPWALGSLIGCGLCGLSVAVFWPGVFDIAARDFRGGGTPMFALLALGGDLGCSFGPSLVGWVADAAGGSLRPGLLAAIVFPLVLAAGVALYGRLRKKRPAGV